MRSYYGHQTIPRHLRDIVVTQYGVADLRGRSDAEEQRLVAAKPRGMRERLLRRIVALGLRSALVK